MTILKIWATTTRGSREREGRGSMLAIDGRKLTDNIVRSYERVYGGDILDSNVL